MERRALHNVPISSSSAKAVILNAFQNCGIVMEISIVWTGMMNREGTISLDQSAVSANMCDNAKHVLTAPRVCENGLFQCLNDNCTRSSMVCNGHNDCSDGSDEGPVSASFKNYAFVK